MKARSEARISMALPVRVFGTDAQGRPFNDPALTIDVSLHGGRIQGLGRAIDPGEIVGVRCGTEKARYRVVWVSKPLGSSGQQLGLYCQEPGVYIWGLFPSSATVQETGNFAEKQGLAIHSTLFSMSSQGGVAPNRRAEPRFGADGSARLLRAGTDTAEWATLYDLSRSGCYLETRNCWPTGTLFDLTLDAEGIRACAKAEVATSHPSVGMGLHFVYMTDRNRQRFDLILNRLQTHCEQHRARSEQASI